MNSTERKDIAEAVASYLSRLADNRCDWITEEKAVEMFPFSKAKLKELRLSGILEFRMHWKYVTGESNGRGRGRSGNIIYHRGNMLKFVEEL